MADIKALDQLLSLVSEHIDPCHCRETDDRYHRTLMWQEVDRPPLVVKTNFGDKMKLTEPWNSFKRYSYREAFNDPAAMLHNQILDCMVPGLILGDDNPLAIRNNHGTIQVAAALGASWKLHEDNFPWAQPVDEIRTIIDGFDSCMVDSLVKRSVETLTFYRDKLAQFPPCREAIQISMPDLQGPMDNAEMLWGSEIYCSFADKSTLLQQVFTVVVQVMLELDRQYRPMTHDRLDPACNTQHSYQIPGRLLIRNDSSIMLSPDAYAEFVRPYDAELLEAFGGGSIHFCGNGEHLIEKMLEIPGLRGLDFGQSHMINVDAVYPLCSEHRVAITNLRPSRADLVDGTAARRFPTGAVFVYATDDIEDAQEVVRLYKENTI